MIIETAHIRFPLRKINMDSTISGSVNVDRVTTMYEGRICWSKIITLTTKKKCRLHVYYLFLT